MRLYLRAPVHLRAPMHTHLDPREFACVHTHKWKRSFCYKNDIIMANMYSRKQRNAGSNRMHININIIVQLEK